VLRMRRSPPHAHLISISRIQIEKGIEISMLRLRGCIAPTTLEDLSARLAEAGGRSAYLVVDLGELDGVGEEGIEPLLSQARMQERRGGWLRVVAPQARPAGSLREALAKRPNLPPGMEVVEAPAAALADLPGRAA
jgi:anti-anti-sigma regulatory factor